MASATLSTNVSCDHSEQIVCVWLEDQTQKWLSVSGTVMKEKSVPVIAGWKLCQKFKALVFFFRMLQRTCKILGLPIHVS